MNNFIIFIFGASIGSFLNVLIDRLPNNKPITGRSHCDYCKKEIPWHDLIPILSFIFLRGRCRYCHQKLSLQYPLVEILTGTAFVAATLSFRASVASREIFFLDPSTSLGMTLGTLGIISCFIVIFFSDLKYHLISDDVLFALFIFSFLFHLPEISLFFNFLLSGLVVCFPIFLIYFISKERAMGLGDVYLSAIIGFLLGWKSGFIALYIAFVTGAIIGIGLIILHRKKIKSKIAFGPFLVIGTIVMLFYGEKIMEVIKRIYGY